MSVDDIELRALVSTIYRVSVVISYEVIKTAYVLYVKFLVRFFIVEFLVRVFTLFTLLLSTYASFEAQDFIILGRT